jgi:hypothetical protein
LCNDCIATATSTARFGAILGGSDEWRLLIPTA